MKTKILLCLLYILLLNSCFSIKPGTTKSGKNLWEEFFVSPGVMQYFIKPLLFQCNDRQFIPDFTFRNSGDSVTVNFSITDTQNILVPSKICFINSNDTVKLNSVKTLLFNKTNKKLKLRMTGKISNVEFSGLIKDNNWVITQSDSLSIRNYLPSDRTKTSLKKIETNLYDIIR
jgi:hypothetical protein